MFRRIMVLAGVVVGVWGLSSFASGADIDKGLCFYLPFDKSLDAKVKEGIVAPEKAVASQYEQGKKGDALIIDGREGISYQLKDANLLFEQGTISLWIKANYDIQKFIQEEIEYRKQGKKGYYNQNIVTLHFPSAEVSLDIGQNNGRFHEALYTAPRRSEQHCRYNSFPWKQGEWLHLIATWDIEGETMEFYLDGKRTEGRIRGASGECGLWEIAESPGKNPATIRISGGTSHYKSYKEEERTYPDNFTYTIDEVGIYNRELTEGEIKEMSK